MKSNIIKPVRKRTFLPDDLLVESWKSIEPYFIQLSERSIRSVDRLKQWLLDRSEVGAVLEENLAWRYIRMNCDTSDKKLADDFNHFVTEIEPKISTYSNILDKKLVDSPYLQELDQQEYLIPIRATKNRIEIFREENIPLFAQLQVEEQEYGKILSQMTVSYQGRDLTLQMAANYLKEIDRETRKTIFTLISDRRLQDAGNLQDLFSKLLRKRNKVASNANFNNFRDYKFAELGRFDYSVKDCEDFHESISAEVVPIVERILKKRKNSLGLKELRPWDLDVDQDQKPPLTPFTTTEELINRSVQCLNKVKLSYGDYLQSMGQNGFLDLDSRKGKAPGGFNYPLYESNIPFIFMNATGNLRDIETMVHESGHAIHSFLTKELEIIDFKNLPSEVAELASMTMELLSMAYWDSFFPESEELKRAKKSQLEGILMILPWIASVDKFQHWIYLNPNQSGDERNRKWIEILDEFGTDQVNWSGFEKSKEYSWQKQLHIFENPFYYIEYGIAQLGAIAIWKNYTNNPERALDQYEKALKLGYSTTIPEIYRNAGIEFNFSKEYVQELMQFVSDELEKLDILP
jgi:oligoendopeptidase F